jgi:peptidoglycan/LPS O-acetylase OafA/YrhL
MTIPLSVESASVKRRFAAFDGLRGIAIILVVISHGWTVWPTAAIENHAGLNAVFTSGDFAVSIFFVIGAFLATRSMLRSTDSEGGIQPSILLVRRWIRVSGQMYVLLLTVLLVTALDSTDTYPATATRESVFRAMTYTWNWYVKTNALEARPDLGHLWYLSVDMQMFVVILVLVWLLRNHRVWLVVALGACLLSLLVWRTNIYEIEGPFSALLRTWARGDAPMAGALAAAALPFLGRFAHQARLLTVVAALSLVPLLYYNSSVEGYFHLPGVLLDVALMAFVAGCALAPVSRIIGLPLELRPLTFLGRHSLSIYLWHYPLFWFVARHTVDWGWPQRTLAALALTAVAAFLSERYIERRVQGWLAAPGWRGTDRGLVRYLGARAKQQADRIRHGNHENDDSPAAPL